MGRTSLPPGFRFHPTDVELIMYHLKRKVMGKKSCFEVIAEVNIYKFSPCDLPDKSCLKSRDVEWYFFCPREKKYASGARVKRATEKGYWKTTGKDRPVLYNDKVVGMVKTLVFHLGHAPKGQRTDWVIHEYKIHDQYLAEINLPDSYVLCKVFKKNGPGPKNGAQYGAPFIEADWEDDDDIDNEDGPQTSAEPVPADCPSSSALALRETQSCSNITSMIDPPAPSLNEVGTSSANDDLPKETDDEMLQLLARFFDDDMCGNLEEHIQFEKQSTLNNGDKISAPCLDGTEVFSGLDDLCNWRDMSGTTFGSSSMGNGNYFPDCMFLQDDSAYLELNDLATPLANPGGIDESQWTSPGNASTQYNPGSIEQFCSRSNISAVNEYTRALPEGFNGHMGPPYDVHQDVFQREKGNGFNACDGCTDVHSLNFVHGQPGETAQEMDRGRFNRI